MIRKLNPSPGWIVAAIGGAVLTLTVGAGAIFAGPTRGPIPAEAFPERGGEINRALVPAYIPAVGPSGDEVGWVARELAVPIVDDGNRLLIPVYGDDLSTVVGHMVAGYGFVPIGTDLELFNLPAPPQPEAPTE